MIEAAGTEEAWQSAIELVRPGGTVVFFGGRESNAALRVDAYRLHYEELTLRGAFHHAPRHVRAALAFLASGAYPWERLVTHQVGLEGAGAVRRPAARLPEGGRRPPKSVRSGSRSPRSTARSTSTQRIPRDSASVTACGLNDCAARMPRHALLRRIDADEAEVARQLLDRLDRPDPLDLDRDPAVVAVAAHQIDRADLGHPLAPDEPELALQALGPVGERLLQVLLDAVLLEPGHLVHRHVEIGEHLGDPDLQLVLRLAGALAHDDQAVAAPRSQSAASSSSSGL